MQTLPSVVKLWQQFLRCGEQKGEKKKNCKSPNKNYNNNNSYKNYIINFAKNG